MNIKSREDGRVRFLSVEDLRAKSRSVQGAPAIKSTPVPEKRVNKYRGPNEPERVSKVKNFVQENLEKEAVDLESDGFACYDDQPIVGFMKSEKAREKMWNPKTMIPNILESKRPKNSMLDKYGPSSAQLAAHLPTMKEMLESRGNDVISRNTRRARKVIQSGDMRPMLPPPPKDRQTKGNRPRVNEDLYREALNSQRKYLGL